MKHAMPIRRRLFILLVFALPGLLTSNALFAAGWHAEGSKGAVAAGGQGAVDAGMEILRNGGNAADAAVATILALSVTDSGGFCFGGEVPILIYDAKRKVVEVVAGMGTAPRLATKEFFRSQGGIPANGLTPAAVPSALDACVTVLDRYGTLTFSECAAPALALLDHGSEGWHADLAKTIRRLSAAEAAAGPDRKRGLRAVADYFYRGPLARELDAWCRENGGLIRYSDLATHVTRIEEPVSTDYRGYTVYKCGPWTQGPYVLQTLQLLKGFDLASLGADSPQAIHITIEAMKLALADRDVYYADPLFSAVPMEALLSNEYSALRRVLVDPAKASLELRPGDPLQGRPLREQQVAQFGPRGTPLDTTTCLVADSEGNVVAATPSGWSGVVAGSTGVWLGTRLQSFNTIEGSPNCIEPGKRPRITLTPTLVLKDGQPALAISVAGGDGQDQATLQLLLNQIDYQRSVPDSVTAHRFGTNHHVGSFRQTPPELGSLILHESVDKTVVDDLAGRGHRVSRSAGSLWAPCLLRIDLEQKRLQAAGDPGAGRHAAAW